MSSSRGPAAAGFAAVSHGKLILLLAVTTALLGVSGAVPLLPALRESLAGTLAGDHFIRNAPTFAPTDFLDFFREQAAALEGTRRAAAWAALLGVALQMFFAGGIVEVLGRGTFGFGQFLEPARRNFWHNVKCFLLFAVSAAIVLGVWFAGAGALARKAFESSPPDASIRLAARWISAAVGVLLLAALSLLYDFARAARRYAPTIGAWRACRFARRALSGSWLSAVGLWLFWATVGGAAVLAAFALAWEMPAVSIPMIALLFLVQFGVLWLRAAVRVAAWGCWIAFLDPRARRAIAETTRIRYTVSPPAGALAPTSAPTS